MGGIIGASSSTNSGVIGDGRRIRQIKNFGLGILSSGYGDSRMPSSAVGFDKPILTTSVVYLQCQGTLVSRTAHNDMSVTMYFNGGGIGDTYSGKKFHHSLYNYHGTIHTRIPWGGNTLDTAPGSTAPTYSVLMVRNDPHNIEFESDGTGNAGYMTIMELAIG